jgi:hypothetical protein
MPILASDTLHAPIRAVCAAGGSAQQEAALVADQLLMAARAAGVVDQQIEALIA